MSLIKKAAELEIPTNVKMIIYGQAGTGKTTIALSAPKPLLLDFDNGVKRVNLSHLEGVDIVQITKWQEVQEVMNYDLSAYDSIVVDTLGKMMDFVISFKCGNRMPTIREWSGINAEFTWFVRTLSMMNKNIVFVAHRDTRKEGDETVFIPALREKSYNSIVTDVDLLGYMEMRASNGKVMRTITFDPTNRNDGKNTCNLPSVMEIPTIIDKSGKITGNNDFIDTQILKPYFAMLQQKKNASKEYDDLKEQIDNLIEGIVDAATANAFMLKIKTLKHIGNSLQYGRTKFKQKVDSLDIYLDEATKQYKDANFDDVQV